MCVLSVSDFLNSLNFVGPFRSPPARRYSLSQPIYGGAAIPQEKVIELLLTEEFFKKVNEKTLQRKASYWLKKIGIADKMKIELISSSDNLFTARISSSCFKGDSNIADVGFGVSQVLPVIIQGLLTPENGTYIVQQPEIHLHPDAQAAITDFLIYLARNKRRVIAETHSEYMILRLRRRLAEYSKKDHHQIKLKSSICLAKEGMTGSQLSELVIKDNFQLSNLPKNFMNQAMIDRFALINALEMK